MADLKENLNEIKSMFTKALEISENTADLEQLKARR